MSMESKIVNGYYIFDGCRGVHVRCLDSGWFHDNKSYHNPFIKYDQNKRPADLTPGAIWHPMTIMPGQPAAKCGSVFLNRSFNEVCQFVATHSE